MKAFSFAVILLILAASVALAGCIQTENKGTTAEKVAVALQGTSSVNTTPAGTTDARYANLTRFVDTAVAYANEHGKDVALKEFNDTNGTFIQNDLYVFAYGMDGTTLAWPYRQDMVGTNRAVSADPNGVKHIERMIGIAREGGGYVYYITGNPLDNDRQEFKISYVKPVDSTWFVGSGIYLPEVPAQFSAPERDGLVARVKQARQYAKGNGAAKAIRDFNDRNGTFANGTRYIFAYGYNGTTLALPFQPEVIGTNRTDFTDPYGVKVTAWEIAAAKSGGGFVYVDYFNPDTGKPGMKLCYVEPAGDTWFVGSGIYTDRL